VIVSTACHPVRRAVVYYPRFDLAVFLGCANFTSCTRLSICALETFGIWRIRFLKRRNSDVASNCNLMAVGFIFSDEHAGNWRMDELKPIVCQVYYRPVFAHYQ